MTLLSDTPPGAIAGPAAKPEVPHVGITFPYPTMAQRAEREKAGLPADVKLDLPVGVVDSTLSERGAALAAESGRTIGDALPEQKPLATPAPALRNIAADEKAEPTVAEKLVATAAKAMGLDAGEAKAAAELPPANAQDQANQAARAQLEAMPVAGAAKPGKTRRAPMPMVQRLQVMEAVRAAPADEPDTELAARLSVQLDRAIGSSTIKDYRLQLGLKSVPMPTKAELRAKLLRLQAELAAKEQPTLPGVPTTNEA